MRKISKIVFGLVFIGLTSCGGGSPSNKKNVENTAAIVSPVDQGYCLIFYKLDDFAKVYLDDSLIYDTQLVFGLAPKHDVMLDLNGALTTGDHVLKVEAHNAACTDCNSNKWQIIYEIFQDGESIDYVSNDSKGQAADLGLKATSQHAIEVL